MLRKPPTRRRPTIAQAGPDPVDVFVGSKIRERRLVLGMSQEALGDRLQISFQQLQKYERGANRVSASTLHRLTQILDAPVSYFFDGVPGDRPSDIVAQSTSRMPKREELELMRDFSQIDDRRLRDRIRQLVAAIAHNLDGDLQLEKEAAE
ncbi:MAG: helix-turn-helix transcriptional regulator [Rhodospirillaceae bacterium]|nr:helix-turn-helix transcriptional regulator [Rhodospirillaceae bacterium]MCA8933509.1 helix-turn-helix transcriptional regulator [Rhodospirillaceae bacterium]MCB9960404.1 helix-turn-helix transcriptional regulator [Rhodospirillaceae bacterium]